MGKAAMHHLRSVLRCFLMAFNSLTWSQPGNQKHAARELFVMPAERAIGMYHPKVRPCRGLKRKGNHPPKDNLVKVAGRPENR